MQGLTHVLAISLTTMAIGTPSAAHTGLAILGSLLPDIDHAGSIIGKKIPFFSIFLKHRGITHSLLALVIAYLISPWLALGYGSHIGLDMLTHSGVQFMFPLKGMQGLKIIRTGGLFEKC